VCESAAGGSLAEVFDYASMPKEMDYAKYFAWAGLAVNATATEGKGVWLGANVQARDTGLAVVAVIPDSPAAHAGLQVGDVITAVEGAAKPAVKQLNDAINSKKPGERLNLKTLAREVSIETGVAPQWTYTVKVVDSPTAEQSAILSSWAGTR
jgi:predicted metalloprotease with PDZ domain